MKSIPVKHFSVQSDLKELDPKFQGSGMVGAEKNRPNRIPRTYYYHRNAAPEGVVTAGAHHEYHGELPSGTNLYNMGEDPLGLNKPSWKQTKHGQVYNVPDLDTVERTLARKGFHGYENYGVDGALAYFHKLPVTRAQMARSPILKRKLKKAWPKPVSAEEQGGKGIVNNPDTQAHLSVNQDAVLEGRGTIVQDSPKPMPKPQGAAVSGKKSAINAENKYTMFRNDGNPNHPDNTRWAMTGPASLRTRAAANFNRRIDPGVFEPANQNLIYGRSNQPVTSDRDPAGGWAQTPGSAGGNHWEADNSDKHFWNNVGADSHNAAFPIPSTEYGGRPVHFKWSQYQDGTYLDAYVDNRGGASAPRRLSTWLSWPPLSPRALAQWKLNPQTGEAELSHVYGGYPENELSRIHQHLNGHLATLQGMHKAQKALKSLKKGLPAGARLDVNNPGDQTANDENRYGFHTALTPNEKAVFEDAAGGLTNPNVGINRTVNHTNSKELANASANAYADVYSANAATDRTQGWPEGLKPESLSSLSNQPYSEDDRGAETQFWSHPNFYEWHDAHTSHHNPHPWDKQQALDTARGLGLVKNDQAAGVGAPRYAEFAMPFGKVVPGQHSNLKHYDYDSKLPDVSNLVSRHGFKVYYAGGKHGKPDLANRNYDTGHLMIYDPTPHSGGDFNERNYTDAWRQMHELSHALTHHELNNVYGEGRRIGALGIHRNLNEAMRAVHWEWLAAHKQRELNKQIGIHVPDETFHKELNTIMHDAVHRAVTGKFTEPSQEGFIPHSHKVPLETALDMVRKEGRRIGLQGHHELIRKHEPRPMVKFVKALPKTSAENQANAGVHAVIEDSMLERGAVRKEHPNANLSANNSLSRQPHLTREAPDTQLAMRRARFANMVSDPYHSGKEPWNQANWSAPAEEPLWDAGDKMADRDYWDILRRDVEKVKAVGRSPILKRKK